MSYDEKPKKTIAEMVSADKETANKVKRRAILLMGVPGTGKTNSLKTIPIDSKGLLLDFDNKWDCLKTEIDEGRIDRIDLTYSPENYKDTYSKVKDVMLDLLSSRGIYQYAMADSLTTLYALMERKSFDIVGGDRLLYDHFNWADKEIWDLLYRLIGTVDNLILTAHLDIRGDSDATMKVVPLARKALSNSIPGRFKEVYHASTIGDGEDCGYIWETRPHGM